MAFDINSATQELRQNRLMRSNEEISKFENAMTEIYEQGEIDYIVNICEGFDDKTNHEEVTFGLVHAIESFYNEDTEEQFNSNLLEAVNKRIFDPSALGWLEIIIIRTLNDESATDSLVRSLKKETDYAKNLVKTIANKLIQEDKEQFSINGNRLLEA